DDKKERKNLISHLKSDGKEIIDISESQVNNFAGNMLSVLGAEDKEFIIMSESAFNCLTLKQKETIERFATILYSNVDTIEACGGGSVRCMMAEVFLPKK
ncbi:MAG: arginine deiminase-related protein, partial [Lutibacter sp.]